MLVACCAFFAVQEVAKTGALSPEEELAAFTLAPGFVAELVASEPDTPKVVDIAFDDAGRMWAVTAVEYPVDGNETPEAIELYRLRATVWPKPSPLPVLLALIYACCDQRWVLILRVNT